MNSPADMANFKQIFVQEQYERVRGLENVSLVLDLGAYVGYASAYFLSCFPRARILAVEPDPRNLAICRMNLAPFGERVTLLHGAVWSRCTQLRVSRGVFDDMTEVFEPEPGSPGEVPAWDIPSLIEMAGGGEVDLLKIDIERAELAVFNDRAPEWLPKVRNICIELHGQDCKTAFFRALADFDFDLGHSGELTICFTLRAKTP